MFRDCGRAVVLTLVLGALAPSAEADDVRSLAFVAMDGAPMPLADFSDKALLVVNTDSMCDSPDAFATLQNLWDRYADRGLVVIGVPSADFEIASAEKPYCAFDPSLDFPMTRLEPVLGPDAHPFFRWAAAAFGERGVPRGDFTKFLVAPDGALMAVWPPDTDPEVAAIEAVLPD